MKIQGFLGVLVAGVMAVTGVPAVTEPLTVIASAEALLPAPKITYTSTNRKEIILRWDKVEGADKYGVFIYNEQTGTYQVYDYYKKSAAGSKIIINGLTPGVQYNIRVAALVKTKNDYEIQTLTKEILLTTDLSAPRKVVGYENGKGELTLAWQPVERAVAYRVWYFSEKKGEYKKYKDVKNTSCRIKGLKTYNKYLFKVSAIKKGSENDPDVDNYSEVYSFIVGGGKRITLPSFPKLGTSVDAAVKAMDIDPSDVYGDETGTIALREIGNGGFIMLTFDENGRLTEGIYRIFHECVNFTDAQKKLQKKNGEPKTYTRGNDNLIVWKRSGCTEYFDYSGASFEYRFLDPGKIPHYLEDYYSELGII